ncbi:hypothetical protein PS684_00101 [Pseudomonas fluorescens]|nr:hypothetical protein PS681_00942 [Pseudomonas fluorescens]VVN49858.1 hypothetical protein PS684_00101 [Pseudomonas fluorescens]
MPWLRGGTVAVTNGSTTVVGTNADFAANAKNGDAFVGPDGANYEIGNVASATVISIIPAYKGPTASGVTYAIMPVQGYPKALADAFSDINRQWGAKLSALGSTGNYEILPIAKGGTGSTTLDTDVVLEGANNKYFAGSRVLQSVLTGLSTATATVVAATDPILAAIGKLQAQVTARAMKGANNDITSLSGLTTPLSQVQGGTSSNNGRPRFNEVGVGAGAGTYANTQGMYLGWNEQGNGEGNFTINMGGGIGGFTWRTVNSTNTQGGPRMVYDYGGNLTVPNYLQPRGIAGRQGINGGAYTQPYNFNWTGNFEAWVGSTFIGNVAFNTSDYRIKKMIKDVSGVNFLDRIDAYRVVTYRHKDFEVWSDDGRTRQGLIAHEAQQVNPLAVIGDKDETNEDGTPRVQSLDVMTLVTDLMGAVKELRAELNAIKSVSASLPLE